MEGTRPSSLGSQTQARDIYIAYEDRMIKNALGKKLLIDWVKQIDLFEDNKLPSEAFSVSTLRIQTSLLINRIAIAPKVSYLVTTQERSLISSKERQLKEVAKTTSRFFNSQK